MFSGIVAGLGSIKSIKENDDIISISITAPKNFGKNLKKGASVSVDGGSRSYRSKTKKCN